VICDRNFVPALALFAATFALSALTVASHSRFASCSFSACLTARRIALATTLQFLPHQARQRADVFSNGFGAFL
jgi:hypothetical protein